MHVLIHFFQVFMTSCAWLVCAAWSWSTSYGSTELDYRTTLPSYVCVAPSLTLNAAYVSLCSAHKTCPGPYNSPPTIAAGLVFLQPYLLHHSGAVFSTAGIDAVEGPPDGAPAASSAAKGSVLAGLSWLDRLLPVWIIAAMVLGVLLGYFVPQVNTRFNTKCPA